MADKAASIVRHLRAEAARFKATGQADAAESLEVAVECLTAVYSLDAAAVSAAVDLAQGPGAAVMAAAAPPSATDIAMAERLKAEGNDLIAAQKYSEAIAKYSEAIKLNPSNVVYFSNRAAAYTMAQNDDAAIKDCAEAIKLDPAFHKAHARMGVALNNQRKYAEAITAYQEALRLDPSNERYKESVRGLEARIQQQQAAAVAPAAPAAGAGGLAGLAGLLGQGGAGGMPDMSAMMSNPMLMNMAQQVMSNPAMMQNIMGMLGGNGGGMPPNMAAMMSRMMGGAAGANTGNNTNINNNNKDSDDDEADK